MAGDTGDTGARSRLRLSLAGLVLVVGAAAGCGGSAASSARATATAHPASPTPAAVVSSPSELPPEARCEEFKTRLVGGLVEVASRFKRFGDSVTESGSSVSDAADAINDWALAEQEWVNGHYPDDRYKDVHIAYSSAINSMFHSSFSLTLLLIDPDAASQADIEDVSRRMNSSLEKIGEAVAMLDQTNCDRELPPASTIAPVALPDDPVAAYLALATQLNTRWYEVRDSRSESTSFRADLIAIENSAASRLEEIDFPGSVADDVAALTAALGSAASYLDFASDDEITLLLIGAFSDGGAGPIHDQRAAAASIRERLGLAPMAEFDIL